MRHENDCIALLHFLFHFCRRFLPKLSVVAPENRLEWDHRSDLLVQRIQQEDQVPLPPRKIVDALL